MQVSSCAPGRRGARDEPKVAGLWGMGSDLKRWEQILSKKKMDACPLRLAHTTLNYLRITN